MYKYRNEKNKAIGTDGWNADREESSSCIYTGLWNGSVLVGLIVEHMGDDDSHDEMLARFHAKAQDVVKKCNAYDELLAIQAQLVEALANIAEPANAGCGCSFPCRCDSEGAEAINAGSMRGEAKEALAAYYATTGAQP